MEKRFSRKLTMGVCTAVALCLIGNDAESAQQSSTTDLLDILGVQNSNVYVGLSYTPTWSKIVGFKIGALDGSTRAVYPHLHSGTLLMSGSFNWNVQDPKIRFGNSMLFALEGEFGYREGNTRIEIEVGYKKFETIGYEDRGRKRKTATVYLLAKELPYDVMSGNTERLSRALAEVDARDIVSFARTVGQNAKSIDNKICNRKGGYWADRNKNYGAWSCDELSYHDETPGRITQSGYGLSYRFGNLDGHDIRYSGAQNQYAGQGWPGTTEKDIKTAVGMAEDLTGNLSADERAVIAGILSKTVSGAEIVEIRAITAASVMINACYDIHSQRSFVIPFVCAGVGATFVGIVEGHVTPKVAYKLKAGLSYEVTPGITAFVNGFYNKVLGEDGYNNLPVQRMRDDISPEGRSNHYAKALFKMSYIGAEVGLRAAF